MQNMLCLYRYLLFKNLSVFYDKDIKSFKINTKKFLKKEYIISFQLGYIFTQKGIETLILHIIKNNSEELRIGQFISDIKGYYDEDGIDLYYTNNENLLKKLITIYYPII